MFCVFTDIMKVTGRNQEHLTSAVFIKLIFITIFYQGRSTYLTYMLYVIFINVQILREELSLLTSKTGRVR